MLSPQEIFEVIQAQGICSFAGVPDSLLKSFCAYVADHTDPSEHTITANEGNAVALAVGHFLGSGCPALVYMQNSGFGNAINPLASLADPDVYGIPILVMVGWRGAPGIPDEPQHVKQGRIMKELLDALGYPWWILGEDTRDPAALITDACCAMRKKMTPVVILVKPATFAPYKLRKDRDEELPLSREDAIKTITDLLEENTLIVSTTGKISRELYECREAREEGHDNDFLTVGSMGHASSIAMGLAAAQPSRRVVCLDGDGAVFMHMGALAIIGRSGLGNLVHIVLNNGAHDSVGGQPTLGLDIKITEIAEACGYRHAISIRDSASLTAALNNLPVTEGPLMIDVHVRKGARSDLGRPRLRPVENRDLLMDGLCSQLECKE